jgi:hypothetical protein
MNGGPSSTFPQDVDERTRRPQAFLYGGYLFSEFAEQLAAARQPDQPPTEHLWQPKRSRLYLAAELKASQHLFKHEEQLFATFFARVKEIRDQAVGLPIQATEWPPTLTFLPLLLESRGARPGGPTALLELALEWRRTDAVQDYRAWWGRALSGMEVGPMPVDFDRDLRDVLRGLAARFGVAPGPSEAAKLKGTVALGRCCSA